MYDIMLVVAVHFTFRSLSLSLYNRLTMLFFFLNVDSTVARNIETMYGDATPCIFNFKENVHNVR